MRNVHAILLVVCCALLLSWGCDTQVPVSPEESRQLVAAPNSTADPVAIECIARSGWEMDEGEVAKVGMSLAKSGGQGLVCGFERRELTRGVVHYKFEVRTGPGAYDRIGIHRVVKEGNPCRPNKSKDAIFLLHGDAKDFEGMFLLGTRSSNTPDDFGLAIFLADNNVDVWGIDQAWSIVPAGTTNFDFMKDWGLQKNIDDLLFAMAVARSSRSLTGDGCDKMILLGYSSGGATGYAALGQETQRPMAARQIKGFVCADMLLKTNDPAMRQSFVNDLALYNVPYENGIYQADLPFQPLAQLARTDPDGPSPLIPGLSNMQAALYFGSGQIFGADVTTHYLGGILDATGFPVDLRFITIPQWLDFLAAGVPYEANKFIIDYDRLVGEVGDSPFDDHMGEIHVPVFNIGAKGGIGPYTLYGTTLLGSQDITHLIVEMGTGNTLTEFGHIDLFAAPQAPTKVWQPILKWLKAHRN